MHDQVMAAFITEMLSLIDIYPVPITTEMLSLIYIYPVPITDEMLSLMSKPRQDVVVIMFVKLFEACMLVFCLFTLISSSNKTESHDISTQISLKKNPC